MTIDTGGKTIRYKDTASLPGPGITYIRALSGTYVRGDAYCVLSTIGLILIGGNLIQSVSRWSGSNYSNSALSYTFDREFHTIEYSYCYTFAHPD